MDCLPSWVLFSKKSSVPKIVLELSSCWQFSMLCSLGLYGSLRGSPYCSWWFSLHSSLRDSPRGSHRGSRRDSTFNRISLHFSFGDLSICQIVSGVINLLWTSGLSNPESRLLIVTYLLLGYLSVTYSVSLTAELFKHSLRHFPQRNKRISWKLQLVVMTTLQGNTGRLNHSDSGSFRLWIIQIPDSFSGLLRDFWRDSLQETLDRQENKITRNWR